MGNRSPIARANVALRELPQRMHALVIRFATISIRSNADIFGN